MDNRALSAVFGYVLTLGIVTLLIGGLFLAAGNYVEGQHDRAVRAEFEVVGNRIAADIAAMDRLALAAGADGEAELQVDLPPQAAGRPYQIAVSPVPDTDTVYHVNLTTADGTDPVAVEVRAKSRTDLASTTVSGGDIRIVYNGTALEVRNG